ncbi:MAG: hypothetical protein K6A23_15130 [Butyrivibrio sp.]|nr:hypothetical protein [Butyrivibrio sp.]
MRGKFAITLLSILTVGTVSLTGCGSSFPELTDEEYEQTIQYAAGLLMRYSNNAVEKLIYVNPDKVELEEEDEEDKASASAATTSKTTAKETTTAKKTEESTKTEEIASATNASSDAIKETIHASSTKSSTEEELQDASTEISISAVEDLAEENNEDDDATDISIESSSSTDIEIEDVNILSYSDQQEIMDGLFLRYNGYYVTSSYPENAKTMVIEASEGKRLLIFSFRAVNESGKDIDLDMVSMNPYFQLSINGKNLGYTSVTMLDNDLSTFKGTIPAGESQTLVLVKEIDASVAKNIDTLELVVNAGDLSQVVYLE